MSTEIGAVVATSDGEEILYADVIVLCHYMAENGYEPDAIAYAVEKPWKYTEEIKEAKEVESHEASL